MPFLTIQLVDEKDDAVAIAKTLGEGFEYFEVNRIPPRDVAEVLQRVPESYEKGPALVLRCAANRHFRETVASAVSRGRTSKEDIDEGVIEAFKSVQGQVELADKELMKGIEDGVKREKELERRLKKERRAREKAEKELRRTNQMIRIARQIIFTSILLVPAALATWAGYTVTKPQLFPISMGGVAWIIGSAYLCLWIWLSIRRTRTTPRSIAGTFLGGPIILMLPLFRIYAGNVGALGIIVTVFVSILGLGGYLVKSSWLDVRIMIGR